MLRQVRNVTKVLQGPWSYYTLQWRGCDCRTTRQLVSCLRRWPRGEFTWCSQFRRVRSTSIRRCRRSLKAVQSEYWPTRPVMSSISSAATTRFNSASASFIPSVDCFQIYLFSVQQHYAVARPCACLFVCVVVDRSKRLKSGLCNFHHTVPL